MGHVGPKKVVRIDFPTQSGETPWLVVQNLGLFTDASGTFTWLCDEAITPIGGLQDLVAVGSTGDILLAGDSTGLYRSTDAGCTFEPLGPPFDEHVMGRISVSRDAPNEVLATTQTLGRQNDIYRSTDSGETWSALTLPIEGRIRQVLRSKSDAQRIYVMHSGGGLRSRNGGESFEPMPIAPADRMATGVEVDLLAVDESNSARVFAVITGFPTSTLIVSEDGGDSWTVRSDLTDIPDSLLPLSEETLLMSMPVNGVVRSEDGGRSWTPIETPEGNGWMSCLTIDPTGKIWGCINRDDTFLAATSMDQGFTWTPVLDLTLAQAVRRRSCPVDTPAEQACVYVCEDYPAACPADDRADQGIPALDDGGIPQDGSMQNSGTSAVSTGCMLGRSPVNGKWPWMLISCFVLLSIRARRRPPSPV